MEFDEILHRRFSTRAYDSRPIPLGHIRAICEAARLAPSACNSQTWRFIAISEHERIERLCEQAMRPIIRNRWLRQAPLIIAGCAKLDLLANRIGAGVTGIDYYQVDMGIALEHMVLKATELGLGSCWIGWFNEEKVKEVLEIPKRVRVVALLAMGYPAKASPPRHKRKPLGQILFAEAWDKPMSQDDGGQS